MTKIYLYNFIKLIWFFCITRSTQGLINERNKSMLHIELFISFDGNIYIDWIQDVKLVFMESTAAIFVAAIVKTMIHATMLMECVLVDVGMGTLEYAVIAVRNLIFFSRIILYTSYSLYLITMLTFMWIIACKAGSYGKKLFFSMFSKLQCNMWTNRWIMWGL